MPSVRNVVRKITRRRVVVISAPLVPPRVIDLRPQEPSVRRVADWQAESIRRLGLCESETQC